MSNGPSTFVSPLTIVLGVIGCICIVYIDLGANDGSSLKYFFEEFSANKLGEKDLKLNEWEAYLFELNPLWKDDLQARCDSFAQLARCDVVLAGAWNATKTVGYFYDITVRDRSDRKDVNARKDKSVGTSLYDRISMEKKQGEWKTDGCVIDFVEWIKRVILEGYRQTVFLKVDIEGAEYTVVRHLLDSGVLRGRVKWVAIEWHGKILVNFLSYDFMTESAIEGIDKTSVRGAYEDVRAGQLAYLLEPLEDKRFDGFLLIVVNYPLVIAVMVGASVMMVGIYCKVRSRGLLVYLPESMQNLLLHSSVFDLLVDRKGVTKLSRLMQRLLFIAFNPHLSDESIRECLLGMDEDFLERVLQPGLAHLLPRKVQRVLMPPSRLSKEYRQPTALPSVRIDRRMAGDIIEYKRRHKGDNVASRRMPPPFYKAIGIVAQPTIVVVTGKVFAYYATLRVAALVARLRIAEGHYTSVRSQHHDAVQRIRLLFMGCFQLLRFTENNPLTLRCSSRLRSNCWFYEKTGYPRSSLVGLAGSWAVATAANKYFNEDDDNDDDETNNKSSDSTLSISSSRRMKKTPKYETVGPSRVCPPLLTSTYLAFHISQKTASN
ncbi:hypothetical protein FOL47_006410 [Perkinsus chesapeaki]|uniref:Methyltransferase FkbM domain-containing protein n=1 Tax=Perkinsus chesapeaki TaxID=330153 RepID=A0A7J6LSY5_PERCH|nr:hypothetical protein FOL47_006410 [Perkinsus chesapeaki]